MSYEPCEVGDARSAWKDWKTRVQELESELEMARAKVHIAFLAWQQSMDAWPGIYKPRAERSTDDWEGMMG